MKTIKIIIALFLVLSLIAPAYAATILSNAETYLSVGHDYGHGNGKEACHPSVIDFLTEQGMENGWGGYRYWMVTTTDSGLYHVADPENPYIYGSNDGTTWTQILQLDDYGGVSLTHAAADPELIYDVTNNVIVAVWQRETDAPSFWLVTATINSSGTRSAVTNLDDENDADFGLGSPTVIRADATHWHMWGVVSPTGMPNNSANQIYYRFSSNGTDWGAAQLCTEDIIQDSYSGYTPWHIEARANPSVSGQVEIVVSSGVVGSQDAYSGLVLAHLRTTLSAPTTLTAPFAPTLLLAPSASGWDSLGLYRSTFVLRPDGSNLYMDLFYDGYNNDVDRVGFTSSIISPRYLYPANATAASSMDGITLTQSSGIFSLANLTVPSSLDNIVLAPHNLFAMADIDLSSAIDNIALTAHSNIRHPNGSPGGIIKKLDGSPGGVIKRYVNNSWQ